MSESVVYGNRPCPHCGSRRIQNGRRVYFDCGSSMMHETIGEAKFIATPLCKAKAELATQAATIARLESIVRGLRDKRKSYGRTQSQEEYDVETEAMIKEAVESKVTEPVTQGE